MRGHCLLSKKCVLVYSYTRTLSLYSVLEPGYVPSLACWLDTIGLLASVLAWNCTWNLGEACSSAILDHTAYWKFFRDKPILGNKQEMQVVYRWVTVSDLLAFIEPCWCHGLYTGALSWTTHRNMTVLPLNIFFRDWNQPPRKRTIRESNECWMRVVGMAGVPAL